MKKTMISKGVFLTLIGMLVTSVMFAQDQPKPPASPADSAIGTISGSTIKIDYSSPSVKGRKIWGGLVPYDKVWRLGANKATTFETSKDIMIEGKKLPAGKYSLYAIPGETEWTFIFNSKTGQWGINRDGAATEDPANDVLRVTVKSEKSSSLNERMKFEIGAKGFSLLWENLKVPVSVE